MNRLGILIVSFLFFLSCSKKDNLNPDKCESFQSPETTESRVTITQGVYGIISFTQGSCMPGGSIVECFTCPVQRTVRFYEYTTMAEAIRDEAGAAFFKNFRTRLIGEASSDLHGFYQISLPPGIYTMAVVENGKLYSNLFDGQGGIFPVTVGSGKLKTDFNINYKAAY